MKKFEKKDLDGWVIGKFVILTAFLAFILGSVTFAKTQVSDEGGATVQTSEVPTDSTVITPTTEPPAVGEGEAQKYFRKNTDETSGESQTAAHYLALHVGGFFSSDSYSWGSTNHTSNPGRLEGGVTYKLGPLGRVADWAIRGDFIGYQFNDGSALNFSVLPMLMFPDAASAFPIYFGLGLGPGIFFQQIDNLSTLSFNYELVGGVRFFNVIGTTGFFMETGLKNEIHLLSQGQFNGYFLSVGALFVF